MAGGEAQEETEEVIEEETEEETEEEIDDITEELTDGEGAIPMLLAAGQWYSEMAPFSLCFCTFARNHLHDH
ncbi:hypothetical protein [Paenibacillus taihuensis]|uniref:hypothetical protein n=1 Tax=Paenibacillus taihuensis TaxID=1156355 RepID=UPI0011C069C7|nr:hypothetical protein [Paenibacillus taihuensis]